MFQNKSKNGGWQLSFASVRGKAHVDNNLPNQDSVYVSSNDSGNVICAVVSDGAGTAKRSGEGSTLAAKFIAERMCQIGAQLASTTDLTHFVRQEMESTINLARQKIDPTGQQLRDFHCTMVAWLFTPVGAFIAQIGDSVALTTRFATVEDEGVHKVDFFPESGTHLHEVERGEYANETHFITEADWKKHLRISQLPQDVDAVVLMTDGAMDIAMLRGQVFRGFLSNLLGKLITTPEIQARHKTIDSWLDDKQTYGVTGDDKTIFTAIWQQNSSLTSLPVYQGGSHVLPNSTTLQKSKVVGNSTGEAILNKTSTHTPSLATNRNDMARSLNPLFNERTFKWLMVALITFAIVIGASLYTVRDQLGHIFKPRPTVTPTAPIAKAPAIPALQDELKGLSTTVANDVGAKDATPHSNWINVSPDGVIPFDKKGSLVNVSVTAGPELIIQEIKYDKKQLELLKTKEECTEKTVLMAKNSTCSLSIKATQTQEEKLYTLVITFKSKQNNEQMVTKVIAIKSKA
jgi:hypothetical protein